MNTIHRIVTMIPPKTGDVREIHTAEDGCRTPPEVGRKVLIVDLSGTGKKFVATVASRNPKLHCYTIVVNGEQEEDNGGIP